ncbi:MAG TPA: cation:proton antiporter, partial [Candidatus Accumulibacter sp.]|nr:cation:proton antiporter [Accumulibacter sp.]
RAFLRPVSADAVAHPHGEAPLPIVLSLCITAGGTLALFFFPEVPLALAQQMVMTP